MDCPKYGVTLSGSPLNPVIENHSGRTVIAYVLIAAGQDGCGPVYQILLATTMQPAGIPDGGSLYAVGAMPINRPGRMHSPASARIVSPGHGPIVSATLQSVIFADGQFVGADEYGAFDSFAERIKVIAEVGRGEDSTLYFDRRAAAALLAQERKQNGDAAAAQLAELYSSLPTLWK